MRPQEQVQINEQKALVYLYNHYSGMLWGYIYEVVQDPELAEQYMVNVFKDIADQYDELLNAGNVWCRLQQLAKTKLAGFFKTVKDCGSQALPGVSNKTNNLINLMNEEQRNIFCAIYYHGKTSAELARLLNKPELIIRKTLKEAFAIIRKDREHS